MLQLQDARKNPEKEATLDIFLGGKYKSSMKIFFFKFGALAHGMALFIEIKNGVLFHQLPLKLNGLLLHFIM